MKNYNKLITVLALGSMMASCADQDVKEYIVEMPESLTQTEALQQYGNIKDYIDRAAYPNLKIAAAIEGSQYTEKGVAYRVANYNFDEITLGNDMKYASVVGDDGSMSFNTINSVLDAAEEAGMSVYGHTLAWHAQQNTKWLNKLLDDIYFDVEPITDLTINYGDYDKYPFSLIGGYEPKMGDGVMTTEYPKKSYKYYLVENFPTEPGLTYDFVIQVKADREGRISIEFGNQKINADLTTDWINFKCSFTATSETSSLIANPARWGGVIQYQSLEITHRPLDHRPQTDKEKADTLAGELNRWVYGMMEACDGRVKAWDLVNEAISGGGDVNGYYDLQHADGGSSSDFFWQDYLGNEQYVPIVSKAARAAFAEYGGNPADLKLFANDYNLESDWDDNKKLKSLIYWVGVWEKNGATIDGLSSQMHISYYENKVTMKSKADHVVKMLKLMANTGKLVRISELDMGYVDINGNTLKTKDLTDEQHQNMANYYRFIIQMYLKLVPTAQQYSICQWCLTDAPASSGWRANEPVGLWTSDWNRKASYAGYCEALKTPVAQSEDFFEFLSANGLTHYISTTTAE